MKKLTIASLLVSLIFSVTSISLVVLLGTGDPESPLGAFTTPGTRFTDLKVEQDLEVTDETSLSATTTVQEITYGSRFAAALSFTAPTTTGSLVALQNTGDAKLCSLVELNITGAPTNAFRFSVSTTTAADSFSTGVAGNVIASTTVATDTVPLLSNYLNPGTFNGGTVGVYMSWTWDRGAYLLGAMDSNTDIASTTDWSAMAGNLYVTCHTL